MEAAAYEFAETEPMVAAGSEITGCDYKATWGRYESSACLRASPTAAWRIRALPS